MKFALNEEQIALEDAVKDFFKSKVTSGVIRHAMENTAGINFDIYDTMRNELGLTSLIIEEQYGGFGASDLELNIAMIQHGYYLVPSPLRTQTYTTILIQECANQESKNHILPKILAGDDIGAVVSDESTLKDLVINDGKISGTIERVLFLEYASHITFVYDGSLIDIELKDEGINIKAQKSIDQTQPISKITFDNTKCYVNFDGDISKQYEIAKARMAILLSNEMFGCASSAFDMSLAYAKERQQFGKAIGSFQSIKHKLAELYLELQNAKSLCQFAAYISSIRNDAKDKNIHLSENEKDIRHVSSMAKYYVTKIFNNIAHENIQIHGGIGFTYEHDAHLYLKRFMATKFEFGGQDEHTKLLAEDIFN